MTTVYGTTEFSYVADTDYNALAQVEEFDFYTGLYSQTGALVKQTFARELETGRVTGIRTDRETVSPFTISDLQYSYNPVGEVTKVKDAAAAGGADTQCFTYDYLRRMRQAWTPASADCAADPTTAGLGGPAKYWLSWDYDTVGNRTMELDQTTAGATRRTDYRYPAPKTFQPHALQSTTKVGNGTPVVANYAYTETGDMKTRPATTGTQTMDWDSEGRLTTSTDAGGTTSYLYDADGMRLISRDTKGKTLYLPGMEIRFTGTTAARTGTRFYAFGGNTIASRTTAGFTWLTADAKGTSQVAVNPATQQAQVRRQTPFGVPRGATTAWPNNKGFVGGDSDATGLTHLGSREYDPGIGRFISVDPIWDMLDPQQWNGYAYANSSPVTFADPTGTMIPREDWGGSSPPPPAQGRPPAGGDVETEKQITRDYGPSHKANPETDAHMTAVALRVLDLKRLYKGAWVTATPGSGAGADLVCWNCAAIASKGQAREVWVWEVKSEGQSQSTALKSLNAGIVWASDHILRGRQGGQPIPVKPGRKFPTPSSGVNRMNPRQVVTVYSDPKSQVDNGVEYYRTDDFEKRLPANHKLNRNSEEANIAIDDSREETKRHMIKAADTVGVKDDPVSGWLIAGGIGLGVAFGGWAIAGLLPGGAAAAGGAAVGVQGQYGLAG